MSFDYARAVVGLRAQLADLWDALLDGRLTEAEAVAGVLAIRREAEGVHTVAAAEVVVLEAVCREQAERIAELEQRLNR